MEDSVVMLNTEELDSFKNHPYRVLDEAIQEIMESVKARGIQEPLIVRRREDNRFEIRRMDAIFRCCCIYFSI